jgi:hypothetical protein
LISEDAPHEYGCSSLFVELALDEDEHFGSSWDAALLRLVERKLPLNKPLEDKETPIRIFEVRLVRLVSMTSGSSTSGGFSPSARTEGACWSLVKTLCGTGLRLDAVLARMPATLL